MSPARRTFGTTWWGRAWTDALEHRARLDPNRLPRGRTYARQNRTSAMRLSAGEITATVAGRRPRPYTVHIRIRTFDEGEWEQVLGAIATKAGHAAALLDGELDPGIVEDARAVGIELLPDAGELQPRCSCPDWADPCKHSAAVCYLVADELDADPFALFELRGRGRDQILAELRRRRSGATTVAAGSRTGAARSIDTGMPAREAWHRRLAALPDPPAQRAAPGHPAPWPVDPPTDAPFSAAGLRLLVADAAQRAWRLSRGEADSRLHLDEPADLARRASVALGSPEWEGLAGRSGVAPRDLAGRAIAWRHAGNVGLQMLAESAWRPPTAAMAAACDSVVAAGVSRREVRVESNRLTLAGGVQLRLGRDSRWYRFEKSAGRWQLAAPPADDPEDLLDPS